MKNFVYSAVVIMLLGSMSCKKKSPEPTPEPEPTPPSGPTYSVPTTYTFVNASTGTVINVNYSGQTTRLDMLAEMKTYMSTGNTSLTVVNAQKLKDMYAGSNFTNTALNGTGKDIKSKTFLADQALFETYMGNLEAASQSTVAGSNGVAGVVSNGTNKYLCDANGVEWTQVIEKGLMGSLMYYQTTAVYLDASKIGNSVDNSSVTPGQGTTMEHHWDEAFGYFGVPTSFPTSTVGIRFWGKYCNDRNAILGTNSIMTAFLTGRAAISNQDYTTRDAQVTLIRDTWEKVIAATIISYVNKTKLNMTDDAVRNHNLSEIKGFIMNLKCNPTKKITATQISALETALGTNFYNITISNLDQIKDDLSTIYGLDSVKNNL
jgi:hypothetical protein